MIDFENSVIVGLGIEIKGSLCLSLEGNSDFTVASNSKDPPIGT